MVFQSFYCIRLFSTFFLTSRFFKVQVFPGPGFSGFRFCKVKVFQGLGFSGFESRVWVQVLELDLKDNFYNATLGPVSKMVNTWPKKILCYLLWKIGIFDFFIPWIFRKKKTQKRFATKTTKLCSIILVSKIIEFQTYSNT